VRLSIALISLRRQSLITKFISSKTSGMYLLSMQYMPLNLSPVLLEIIFKLRISPAPLKKPAAFAKVGAAVIAEAAKAPRINLLEKLLFSVFPKINYSLTNKIL
jgi:hypothetical protein